MAGPRAPLLRRIMGRMRRGKYTDRHTGDSLEDIAKAANLPAEAVEIIASGSIDEHDQQRFIFDHTGKYVAPSHFKDMGHCEQGGQRHGIGHRKRCLA